ncbi:uncharacterized protein PHACADRAFT_189680 [Phanerochaete carnosa HHB-10118-sp]|uniref:F-box domain-containing protein n=1 Tax=Phanerochaete carnosa (strain HHB-10118-sp) TaxID=650164 RepID=K5XC41_PHACS|nr:uncharacterized protein PHACADRAFT_189680 [Phanerochaete carnosa HHB-10118-sp]EKM60557.1 hypothetical protein PHACADRAFT_189680 [Phanerochaete carnosa HHB-10118-sp]
MSYLNLSQFPALRFLTFEVVFNTLDNTHIIHIWTSILAVIRSIPKTAFLEHITLSSPVPHTILCSVWSRSTLVQALERLLYSVDRCFVRLIDRAQLRAVTLVPPSGEEFIEDNWVHIRSFFPALWDYVSLVTKRIDICYISHA